MPLRLLAIFANDCVTNNPRSEMHETYGYFTISTLQKDYTDGGGNLRRKGFYLDYCLEQYEGTNYEKVVEKIKKKVAKGKDYNNVFH